MAIDLFLDENTRDLVIENGELKTTTSRPILLRQRLAITFRTFVGEWFANTLFGGIDREIVFQKATTKEEIDSWFISVINSFEEVEQLKSFNSTVNAATRNYDLDFVVATSEGNATFFVRAGVPTNDIAYKYIAADIQAVDCDVITTQEANEFYILLNIDIPSQIQWELP